MQTYFSEKLKIEKNHDSNPHESCFVVEPRWLRKKGLKTKQKFLAEPTSVGCMMYSSRDSILTATFSKRISVWDVRSDMKRPTALLGDVGNPKGWEFFTKFLRSFKEKIRLYDFHKIYLKFYLWIFWKICETSKITFTSLEKNVWNQVQEIFMYSGNFLWKIMRNSKKSL